jgi:CIC family chloride channel protein
MPSDSRPLIEGWRRLYASFWSSETAVMLTMALIVGLGSGFGAVAFRRLIEISHTLFVETLLNSGIIGHAPEYLGSYLGAIVPAMGGLMVGCITYFLAPEARGPGVAGVMEALALQGGRIRPIVIAARPIATSITLGSGGSAGREGPVVHLGSAIGSSVSHLARLSDERTKNLVACGAAGGIAATFNAPLAGVMFALEVLLAEFGLVQFTSVVVAAVVASVVGHTYFGDVPAFRFPPSPSPDPWELPAYATLGVAAAFIGVAFTRILHFADDLFERQPLPTYLRPALGGLVVGVVGLWFPQILGIGYDSIEAVLFNRFTLVPILVLGLLKVAVTSITIGSGGSGGIFGPCLFIGAMLGGTFGQLVHGATPGADIPASYALIGMSAVFAAASRAPITAILTIFEMTRDYNIILPLMLATVISATIARHLLDDSIYTVKLSRRGIDVSASRNLDLMSTITVSEAMTPISEVVTVTPSTSLTGLARIFHETHYHGTVVVDEHLHLRGVVTLSDLEQVQRQHMVTGTVADIQVSNVRTVFPDQTLEAALRHFGALDVGRIPVVDRTNPRRVVGLLRRGDIVRAYAHAHVDEQARMAQIDRARLQMRTGSDATTPMVEIRLQDHDWAVGKTARELGLPPQMLIASIRRGGRPIIPRGDTRLAAGDTIVALVSHDEERHLRKCLKDGGRTPPDEQS